jgi:apolipoprotein N-acyltransferase
VAASALSFGLYARFEWPWLVLGWVALVPWLAVLDRTVSLRGALGAGLLMSIAFELAVFGWFASAIQTYTGAPLTLAWFVLLLTAPLLQPQLVAFALARHLARRGATGAAGLWRTALVGAGVYVGTEWASPKLFADTLGYGLYPSAWMRQAADVAGVHGLTFVLIVANECMLAVMQAVTADASRRTKLRGMLAPAGCVAALVVLLLAYGALRCRQLVGDDRHVSTLTAGVVQADISRYDRLAAELGKFDAVRMILDTHFALSAELLGRADLDLLVWPETVYPTTFGSPKSEDGAAFDREIGRFVTSAGVPLVFGAYDVAGEDEFNAAIFLEPAVGGRLTFETYRKASLFPLTERVPSVLESDLVRGWLPWLGTWKPGRGPQVVTLRRRDGRRLRIAPLICYDVLDPDLALAAVRRGAEMIVTLSNDSWFASGAGPRLHLVGAAFRSIETRRPQVRATNTGISAVIAPTGELLTTAGVDERATLVATVTPDGGTTTVLLACGDWLGPSALACGVVLLAAPLVRKAAPLCRRYFSFF